MRYLLLVVLFLGCSLFGGENKDAQVEFRLENNSTYEGELPIEITFNNPRDSKTITPSDFPSSSSLIGPFKTSTSGTLQINVQLFDIDNQTATSEGIKLPLKSDWKYGITIAVGSDNPFNLCFGCQGSKAIAINSKLNFEETDSLFIVWGGNSISNPVLY